MDVACTDALGAEKERAGVALASAMPDAQHFNKQFRQMMGVSPIKARDGNWAWITSLKQPEAG